MVSTTTSTNSARARRRRRAGVSLVEILVAIAIGSIVTLGLGAFSLFTGRGFAGLMNYAELENQSRTALDKMSKEIRQTARLTDYTSNKLVFLDYDAKTLTFEYKPSSRALTRAKDGLTDNLLTECDTLNFAIFQRNTTNGTYDQYPTSVQASNTKVVQVSWTCSRTITGTKVNTETVQSTKIVIRNQ
jgi:prepilin-type N-terminal cleavage/methylation domain-containing protein